MLSQWRKQTNVVSRAPHCSGMAGHQGLRGLLGPELCVAGVSPACSPQREKDVPAFPGESGPKLSLRLSPPGSSHHTTNSLTPESPRGREGRVKDPTSLHRERESPEETRSPRPGAHTHHPPPLSSPALQASPATARAPAAPPRESRTGTLPSQKDRLWVSRAGSWQAGPRHVQGPPPHPRGVSAATPRGGE